MIALPVVALGREDVCLERKKLCLSPIEPSV